MKQVEKPLDKLPNPHTEKPKDMTELIDYLSDKDIYGQETHPEEDWNVREAVRAVVYNEDGEVALMHIGQFEVYKLPGGGKKENETLDQAFKRELLEETGWTVDKEANLGITMENRGKWKLVQISHCYVARTKREVGMSLDSAEVSQDFSLTWVKDINEAIRLVSSNKSDRYDDKYITMRDLSILEKAAELEKLAQN